MHFKLVLGEIPIHVAGIIILAVGIVIAPLRTQHLIAHGNH